MLTDPIEVTLIVVAAMENLDIPYLIGGSLASSIHGIARATIDVDIVADIHRTHAQPLTNTLKDRFYVDADMIIDAIAHQSPFNLIHLESMFKVDVFPLKKDDIFSKQEFKRRQKMIITLSPERMAYVATPEDTVLSKLIWYRLGKGISDRQWSDVVGILKVQAHKLDMQYLKHWATKLNLTMLLKRSLNEAGMKY